MKKMYMFAMYMGTPKKWSKLFDGYIFSAEKYISKNLVV